MKAEWTTQLMQNTSNYIDDNTVLIHFEMVFIENLGRTYTHTKLRKKGLSTQIEDETWHNQCVFRNSKSVYMRWLNTLELNEAIQICFYEYSDNIRFWVQSIYIHDQKQNNWFELCQYKTREHMKIKCTLKQHLIVIDFQFVCLLLIHILIKH